jgi:hypothetical protein
MHYACKPLAQCGGSRDGQTMAAVSALLRVENAIHGGVGALLRIPLDLIGSIGEFDGPAVKLLNRRWVY